MTDYAANNIEEAVEMAHRFKADGSHNWFRGQVQQWPPHSSLYRLQVEGDEDKLNEAASRIDMFHDWIGHIPELKHLQEKEFEHYQLAVKQHYGLPTYLIDFTTDPGVAGFFAADTKNPPEDELSCIYCINRSEVEDYWDTLCQVGARPESTIELVEIDVANLTRLKAQHGVFLYADYNWEIDFVPDKIVFPYTGYPSYPTRADIYPIDKSSIEQRLDQYKQLEEQKISHKIMLEHLDALRDQGFPISNCPYEAHTGGYFEEAFQSADAVKSNEAWPASVYHAWSIVPDEDYRESEGPVKTLRLKPDTDAEEAGRSVNFGLTQVLHANPQLRQKTVTWQLDHAPDVLDSSSVNELLRHVWNGMRRLPYEDEEIADAFGAVTRLTMITSGKALSSREIEARCIEMDGKHFRVGFTSFDRSSSYATVSEEDLRDAIRPDFPELLTAEYLERRDNLRIVLQLVHNPRLLYRFDRFQRLFARHIIPTQAVSAEKLIIFNPAQLMIFGLP